jgi:hypothetical protein
MIIMELLRKASLLNRMSTNKSSLNCSEDEYKGIEVTYYTIRTLYSLALVTYYTIRTLYSLALGIPYP